MVFNKNQPRDSHGRWIKGPSSAGRSLVKKFNITTKPPPPFRRKSTGLKGFKENAVPYVRFNKRSGTIGLNTGSKVTKNKRLAIGGYARLETIGKSTAVDRFIDRGFKNNKVFPKGSKRERSANWLRQNVHVTNPAVRATVGGTQVRLGTSRESGPTIIVRRGAHKSRKPPFKPLSQSASKKAIAKYDRRMRTIAKEKSKKAKPRRQRRRASRKKK